MPNNSSLSLLTSGCHVQFLEKRDFFGLRRKKFIVISLKPRSHTIVIDGSQSC